MPDLSYYAALFHRAAKEEEIGIAVTFENELGTHLVSDLIHASRPKGFEDYTVAVVAIPNTIFIVKPGVRLD